MKGAILASVVVVACGGGGTTVRTAEELPAGKCPRAALKPGERCETGARDYTGGITVVSPVDHPSEVGGTLWFRWPLFDAGLDLRSMRHSDEGSPHRSLAGAVGTHLRPLLLAPRIARYVDVVVDGGFELGFVKESRFRGRGDGYVGGYVDLFAPDIASMKYRVTGVPGLRVGVRYAHFVEDWADDWSLELGVIWRFGLPIDIYHHWTYLRGGD